MLPLLHPADGLFVGMVADFLASCEEGGAGVGELSARTGSYGRCHVRAVVIPAAGQAAALGAVLAGLRSRLMAAGAESCEVQTGITSLAGHGDYGQVTLSASWARSGTFHTDAVGKP